MRKINVKLTPLMVLLLDFGNGDAIHIMDFDTQDVFNSLGESSFEFADGTILDGNQVLARGFDIDGTAGNDSIVGTNTTDRINGLAGDDQIFGMAGDDTLNGGAGDERMRWRVYAANDIAWRAAA